MLKSRGMHLALSAVLAATATLLVYSYAKSVDHRGTQPSTTSVIVSTRDIPAQTSLNDLVAQGVFVKKSVPSDFMIKDAITSTRELQGRTTEAAILAGEQITTAR